MLLIVDEDLERIVGQSLGKRRWWVSTTAKGVKQNWQRFAD